MANGTIAFDTLTTSDSKGGGTEKSVDTSYIYNGVAKYLVHYNQSTPAVLKSINSSSVTDASTGHFTINYTSNFNDALYILNSGMHIMTDDADSDRGGHSVGFESGGTVNTSSAQLCFLYGASQSSASTDLDTTTGHSLYGDLA